MGLGMRSFQWGMTHVKNVIHNSCIERAPYSFSTIFCKNT